MFLVLVIFENHALAGNGPLDGDFGGVVESDAHAKTILYVVLCDVVVAVVVSDHILQQGQVFCHGAEAIQVSCVHL
jgi:hypothetical protein